MFVLLIVIAYLLGAVPFAVLIGRAMRGVDVRRSGSGNAGAMNALRTAGPLAGVLVALLDGGKGMLAVAMGTLLLDREAGALAGGAAVVGHCFSPYLMFASRRAAWSGWKMALRRAGGKGLAAGIGVLLSVAWQVALTVLVVFAVVFLAERRDETWPSIAASLSATPAMWFFTGNARLSLAAVLVGAVITIKHLPDIRSAFFVEAKE